jgi:Integrase core domain
VEGLIGTLRREGLDQMVTFGEAHLRQILSAYAAYYNQARTHVALQKDTPCIEPSDDLPKRLGAASL